ncbi:hypothetical protein D3C85_1703610 [compost metagenome]
MPLPLFDRIRIDKLPCTGDLQTFAIAVEEHDSQFFLELGNLTGKSGLGQIKQL